MRSVVSMRWSRREQRERCAALGVDLGRFHQLAQRIMLGLTQRDIVTVDIDRTLDELRRACPDYVGTHLVAAVVLRARDDRAGAEQARRAAIARVVPGLESLLPSDAEWSLELQRAALVPVGDGLWRLPAVFPLQGQPFGWINSSTIARLGDGSLVWINPVEADAATIEAVCALGEVAHIAIPGVMHGRFGAELKQRLPGARLWGVSGHLGSPTASQWPFDGLLDVSPEPFGPELEVHPFPGHQLGEVVFFQPSSRTLVVNDLLFSTDATLPFFSRLYAHCWGVAHLDMAAYQPTTWLGFFRVRRAIRALRRLEAEAVTGSHLPGPPIRDPAAIDAALRAAEMTLPGWLVHVTRIAIAQPGMTRDNTRFVLHSRKLARRNRPVLRALTATAAQRSQLSAPPAEPVTSEDVAAP